MSSTIQEQARAELADGTLSANTVAALVDALDKAEANPIPQGRMRELWGALGCAPNLLRLSIDGCMEQVIGRLDYLVNVAITGDKNAVDNFARITVTTPTLIEMHQILTHTRDRNREAFRDLDSVGHVRDGVSPQ